MTQYVTRNLDSVVDTTAAGWTQQGGATTAHVRTIGPQDSIPIFRDYFKVTAGGASLTTEVVSFDACNADANRANFEICTVIIGALTDSAAPRLYGRGSGATNSDCYQLNFTMSTGALTLNKRVASATSLVATGSGGFGATDSFFVRWRANGSSHKVKVWLTSLGMAGEPDAWNIDTTDAAILTAGFIGVGSFGTSKISAFNFFSVGTNGDAAICLMTNEEFSAWLKDQTAKRIFLAEFGFTRYDSTGGSASPSVYNPTGKVYISKGGFTSKAYDSPANQLFRDCIKKVPTFSKRMSAQMSGRVEITFGAMDVDNPKGDAVRYYNAALYSEQFDNAVYSTVAGCTVSANAAIAPDGTLTADTLTDANAADYSAKSQTVTVPNDRQTWRVALRIKKTTGGTAKTFGMNIRLTGGTSVSTFPRINTDTGATQNPGLVAMLSEPNDYWLMIWEITNNASGNTSLELPIYPAVSTWPAADSAATTGSATVWGLHVYPSTIDAKYVATTSAAIDFIRQGGIRDYWSRMCFDRDDFRLEIGGEGWSRWNFRPLIVGRIGDPTAPESDILRFQVRGLDDILQGDLNPDVFTSGPALGMREPRLFGGFENTHGRLEPVLVDSATSKYEISRNAINASSGHAFENNVDLAFNNGLAVSAVNTVTGEITFPSAHGLAVDSRLYWIASPPLGMSVGVEYWVRSGLFTSAKITLATTRGGAAITGGAGTLGGTFTGLNYYFTVTGPSYVTLTVAPAATSRITVDGVYEDNGYGGNEATLNALLQSIIFSTMGVSLNYKDTAYFTPPAFNANLIGYYAGPKPVSAIAALNEIAIGMTCWVMQDVDGMFRWAMVDLPSATPRRYLGGSEILADAMTLETVIRKVDFSKASFSYAPWFLNGGPIQGSTPQLQFGKEFLSYTWPVAFFPMDDYPPWVDMDASKRFDSYYSGSAGAPTHRTRLLGIYKKKSGIFKVPAAMPAIEWNIGETVQIDHDRLDWKNFSASNPSSPDNSSSFDARNAIIVGLDIDPDSDEPFAQMIRLWRPIPAYFPTDAILENPS